MLRTLLTSSLVAAAAALAVFGAPGTAAWLLAAACVAPRGHGRWFPRRTVAAGLIAAAVGGWWWPLHEYQDRVDQLAARVAVDGPSALSTRDLLGIWLLNLGMAAGGVAVGFPEVALETALLAVPGPEVRRFRSDFAMGSAKVRAAVAGIARDGRSRQVALTYHDHAEARVGLALNVLSLEGQCEGGELALVGRVDVDYPATGRLPLFAALGRPIAIDESLFDALEARGWLHPYVAEWRWTETAARCAASTRSR